MHGFVLEVAHAVVVTDHLRTGRENLGGNDQIFVIAAADDEHLFMLAARNVAQFNARAFEGGKFRKECRFALVRGKHDEMALGRNFTEIDRKFGLAPLREAAGVARDDRCGRGFLVGGLLRKDDRQSRVLTGVAFGNERGRELRQVVGQSHESLVEREFAFRGNVHPKRRVGCVFANRLIVADEFHSDLVLAGSEGLRVEIEDERLGLADLLCRQCGRLLQFAVKENVELRNVGEH